MSADAVIVLLAVLVVLQAIGDVVTKRLVYWQRRHIEALQEALAAARAALDGRGRS